MIIQGVRYASDFEAKKLMIETGRDLDDKGYTLACDGSMSVRVGPNAVWVTTQDSENGALSQGDFVRVDLNGKSLNHSPEAVMPEDLEVHLKIYRENPKIQGVIHAYPVCAVVLQKDGKGLAPCSYTPSVRSLGRVTLVPQGEMAQIGNAAAMAARTDKGVLLLNDGCIMWGESIREAYRNLRLLDYCAQVRVRMDDSGMTAASAGAAVDCSFQPGAGTNCSGRPGTEMNWPVHPGAQMDCPGTGGAVADLPGVSGVREPAGAIPGLTGLFRPGQSARQARKVFPPQPSVVQTAQPPTISGLTGLYHPSGEARKPEHVSSGIAALSPERQGIAAFGSELTACAPFQSAPPDPVKESAMAQVIRKSMQKMGKGGL